MPRGARNSTTNRVQVAPCAAPEPPSPGHRRASSGRVSSAGTSSKNSAKESTPASYSCWAFAVSASKSASSANRMLSPGLIA
jgi:hypothetical protein